MDTPSTEAKFNHDMSCKRCMRQVHPAQRIEVQNGVVVPRDIYTIYPCLCGGTEIYIAPLNTITEMRSSQGSGA